MSPQAEPQRATSPRCPASGNKANLAGVAGQGEGAPEGGSPGDLYVDVYVREHEFFSREGNDILCEVPIPFGLAAMGTFLLVLLVGYFYVWKKGGLEWD